MNIQRLKKTFVAILTGRSIMAFRQIILVPVLLHAWGADLYGQWLVLSAIPSFLAMSNLGLGTSAHIKIAMDIAGGRSSEVCATIITSSAAILAIAIVTSAFVLTFVPHFYKDNLQSNQIQHPHFILLFLILTLFVKMLGQPISGVWTGVGRPSYAGHAGNICAVAELALSLIVPLRGGGPLILTLMILAINALWLFVFGAKTLSLIESKSQLLIKPNFALAKQLVGAGIGHQIGPLWQAILFQGSILLANSILGSAGAAMWGSLRVVTRCGNQILELVTQSLGPEFQIAAGKDEKVTLQRLYTAGAFASLAISSCIAIGVMTFGPYLFEIWIDSSYNIPWRVWMMMGLAIVPFSMWWLAGELQRATNNAWMLNVVGVIAAILSVGLMWIFRGAGMSGLAAGSLIFEIMMMVIIFPLTLRQLNIGWEDFLKSGACDIVPRLIEKLKINKAN